MSKVFVVTEGEYSSYHIVGIWTNKRIAARKALLVGGQVETLTLNPKFADRHPGLKPYSVIINSERYCAWITISRKLDLERARRNKVPLLRYETSLEEDVSIVRVAYSTQEAVDKSNSNRYSNLWKIGKTPYKFDLYINSVHWSGKTNHYEESARLYVWAKNEQDVLKVANEFKAQWWSGNLPIQLSDAELGEYNRGRYISYDSEEGIANDIIVSHKALVGASG